MIRQFNYDLTGTGWAEAWFIGENQQVRFEFSYLSDPLSELCAGLLAMINGSAKEIEVFFVDEPGEHRLSLRKIGESILEIEIRWSEEWHYANTERENASEDKVIYRNSDTVKNFSTIICQGIQELMDRQSLEEYKQKWVQYDFPIEAFSKLKTVV